MTVPEPTNSDSNDSDSTSRHSEVSGGADRDKLSREQSSSRPNRSRRRRSRNTSANEAIHDPTIGSDTSKPSVSSVEGSSSDKPAVTTSKSDLPSRYECVGEVGRGGWGIVEKAIDRQLDREVAVKRFTDSDIVTEQERLRFLHEAKVTSQLQHPGIVPVHEMGDREDAFYVIYSLGVILYTIIAGRHPFHGQPVRKILEQVKNATYTSLRLIQPLDARDVLVIKHVTMDEP